MPIVSEHFRSLLDGSSQLHTASAMRIVATIILETRCYYYEVACSACRCGYRSVAPPTSSISNLSSDDIIVTAGCSGWTVRKGGRDAWDAAPTGCHGYGMMRLVPCCLRPLKFTYAARSLARRATAPRLHLFASASRILLSDRFASGTSAGFWLWGSMPPCRLRRRKF